MYDLQTIEHLYERQARIVLCRADKTPAWKGYLERTPPLGKIMDHANLDGVLGIVPSSLACSVLDLDHGDPEPLHDAAEPFASYPSWSGRGEHLWYGDATPRANSDWSALGASGQVRGRNGFVVLPHGAEIVISSGVQIFYGVNPPISPISICCCGFDSEEYMFRVPERA